jgi:hypothetical protein
MTKCIIFASFFTQNIKYFQDICMFFIHLLHFSEKLVILCLQFLLSSLEQWAPVLHLKLVIIAKQPLMVWLARREVSKV